MIRLGYFVVFKFFYGNFCCGFWNEWLIWFGVDLCMIFDVLGKFVKFEEWVYVFCFLEGMKKINFIRELVLSYWNFL